MRLYAANNHSNCAVVETQLYLFILDVKHFADNLHVISVPVTKECDVHTVHATDMLYTHRHIAHDVWLD